MPCGVQLTIVHNGTWSASNRKKSTSRPLSIGFSLTYTSALRTSSPTSVPIHVVRATRSCIFVCLAKFCVQSENKLKEHQRSKISSLYSVYQLMFEHICSHRRNRLGEIKNKPCYTYIYVFKFNPLVILIYRSQILNGLKRLTKCSTVLLHTISTASALTLARGSWSSKTFYCPSVPSIRFSYLLPGKNMLLG